MKRILCFIESIGSGGAERQLTGLAVMLKQQGYQIEVCYYIKKEFYLLYLQENGVDSCFLEEASNPKKRFFALRKHIKVFNPDTVISYSTSPSMITCLLKLLGFKFNLIVSERNTTQQIDKRERFKFFMYKWADCIVPNSHSQRTFIEQHFSGLAKKTTVITNFVDTQKFAPLMVSTSIHEEVRMVCVGRLMPQKNIPTFIDAIRKVVDKGVMIKVDWFGQDFENGYAERCHEKVKENDLETVFRFHKPSPTIQEEYHQADVFCLPSLYEGFPNVLCEAMSCGLPVLCSRVCDNPTIVQEGENGFLFDPKDIDDMAEIMIRFIKLDKNTKINLGRKSREIALAMFSSDVFIKKYLKLI